MGDKTFLRLAESEEILIAPACAQERIKVLSDGPLRPALIKLGEAFRRDNGSQVDFVFGPSQPDFLAALMKSGKVVPGEHPVIGRVGIGLAGRADAPGRDVGTVEAFRQVLMNADSLIFNTVAGALSIVCLLVRPPCASAQQDAKMYRLGYLASGGGVATDPSVEALRQGLRDLGWREGQNLTIEYRYADGKFERFPALAAELVRLKVDVIFAPNTPAAQAAQRATGSIPIVFAGVADPLGAGLVKDLARPGRNVTGFTTINVELSAKRLELLRSAVADLRQAAVFVNPASPQASFLAKRPRRRPPHWAYSCSSSRSEALMKYPELSSRSHPGCVLCLSSPTRPWAAGKRGLESSITRSSGGCRRWNGTVASRRLGA